MKRIRLLVPASAMLLMPLACFAQEPTPAQTPAPTPTQTPAPTPTPSPFTHWGTDFSFLVDGYADNNFNNPGSGYNGLRNFDVRADTAHLNMAQMSIDHAPAPVGFHLDAGFGQVYHILHTSYEKFPTEMDYIKQVYISFKPKSWHGLQVDVGKFVTSAGAEVIETNQNWNYSRSILFAWAIPYYHFGVRTSFPIGPHFTGGVQLVNGWNNVKDNNTGKTIGLTGAYAWKKVTWSNNYYSGPEKDSTNEGWRHLYDTTVLVNQTDKISYYINFDYGRDKNIGGGASQWTGIAGATRIAIGKKGAFAARGEWFDDVDGFSTGVTQQLKEITLTGEYKITGWLISRLEFRNDWSNQPYFEKEHGAPVKSQPTILLGMMAYFGPKK